ncbi:MAG: class I SAM-dependent methyltransferase [Spirochaetaceae bacterium]|jgi:23S rRNA G2069 N7-methylase RlmK/C1962 C5-methylase RlmI|nr:class I SAM-dependent methyltransferase [Spirochaetaceae bacterium]
MDIEYRSGLLYNRVLKRYKHLSKWARRRGIDAFRIYDRDIPEIPLTIDIYKNIITLAWYARRGGGENALFVDAYRKAVSSAVCIPEHDIIVIERARKHHKGGEAAQYEKINAAARTVTAAEYGARFRVKPGAYLDSGLFLDARGCRNLIGKSAANKRLLNLFCYTASFSVAAALGGAAETCSVDLSNTYLNWARENFTLNGLSAEKFQNARQAFESGKKTNLLIRADCTRFIDECIEKKYIWDIIIVDPPVFSNSKKMNGIFDIQRDYQNMLNSCARLLHKDGSLFFSVKGGGLKTGALDDFLICDITEKVRDEDFIKKRIPRWYMAQSALPGSAALSPLQNSLQSPV